MATKKRLVNDDVSSIKSTVAVRGARSVPPIKAHIPRSRAAEKSVSGIPIRISSLADIAPVNAPMARVGINVPPVAPLSLTGNRITMNLTTEDVVGVFEKPLSRLLLEIADIVKKIPLPCVNDIFENGIVLSGGGAMLFGLDRMIERILEIPVVLAKDPMDSVAKGLSRINNFLPARMRGQCKDITSQLAKFYEARNSEKNNK